MMNQKIIPHLWFEQEALEAAKFYTAIFPESQIHGDIDDTSGNIISFDICGHRFIAFNGRRNFTFNPAISFFIHFNLSKDENIRKKIEEVWEKLSDDGKVLMPFDQYPFSEKYGWIQDKYGLSWQLMLSNLDEDKLIKVVPSFMFTNEIYGKAEEAIHFYLSVFQHSNIGNIARYPDGMEPDEEGKIMYADFTIENQTFVMMESARAHEFHFNEAISFLIYGESQDEINRLWEKLSSSPGDEQSGWLKDRYGVSWQIIPRQMEEMMAQGTKEQIHRVINEVRRMKKINIDDLWKAFNGE